jgi:mono/diheme cytochrome c family protein
LKRWLIAVVLAAGLGACAQPPPSLGNPDLDAGQETYRSSCSACHGPTGAGISAPALSEVAATFPDCSIQQQWITLGSAGWKEEVGETYGAQEKKITAVMPFFEGALTATQIAQVAAFERVQFGGASMKDALADCGLG